ncbi:hypothetical protein B2J88_04300 [Rhodococcus sp. SRB_17]|nr:hypothetical protein [Rhodococcus sp. SRB_17]
MCSPRLLSQVYESIGREDRKVSRRSMFAALGVTALGATALAGGTASAAPAALPSGGSTLVDLTHVLTTDFPVWPGTPSFEMKNLASIASTGGSLGSVGSLGSLTESAFYLNELRMGEQTGTHIDAPAHASADGITVEMIPVADLDAGRSTTYGAHRNALGSGKYAVEALANLSTVPPVGATVMIGAPTHAGGSGGPCRVIAWH